MIDANKEAVAQLDYSKPPPGYTIAGDHDEPRVRAGLAADSRDSGWVWVQGSIADGQRRAVGARSWAEALSAAWAHYKAHNDPPGMLVSHKLKAPALEWWAAWVFMQDGSGRCQRIASGAESETRAAAWAWYDRRHALTERGLAHRGRGWAALAAWPRCLTWTDEQVAEVENWLADSTAEMPEVLRG